MTKDMNNRYNEYMS